MFHVKNNNYGWFTVGKEKERVDGRRDSGILSFPGRKSLSSLEDEKQVMKDELESPPLLLRDFVTAKQKRNGTKCFKATSLR